MTINRLPDGNEENTANDILRSILLATIGLTEKAARQEREMMRQYTKLAESRGVSFEDPDYFIAGQHEFSASRLEERVEKLRNFLQSHKTISNEELSELNEDIGGFEALQRDIASANIGKSALDFISIAALTNRAELDQAMNANDPQAILDLEKRTMNKG